jgi:chromosome segregation ATPase
MGVTTHRWWVFVVMSIGVLLHPALGHAGTADDQISLADVKKQTQELLHSLKAYTADQRDEAVQKTKAALDDLDERIDALEARIHSRWDRMDEGAREKARANLKALRERRRQVAAWYDKLKSSSAEAWEDVKQGFSDAYRALDDLWEETEEDSRSKP